MAEATPAVTAQATPNAAPAPEVKTVTDPKAASTALFPSTEPKAPEPAAATPPAKPAVPDGYQLKKPEGSLLGDQAIERISAYAKQKGLSNEDAQSLLQRESDAVKGFQQAQMEQRDQTVEKWAKEVETDKEIGGEGFKQNIELASRVIKKFGDEQLIKDLNESGYGNYPPLVRLFHRIGKAMKEDQLVLPGSMPVPKKSAADMLYGTKTKEN